jgi:hypothetical protein
MDVRALSARNGSFSTATFLTYAAVSLTTVYSLELCRG